MCPLGQRHIWVQTTTTENYIKSQLPIFPLMAFQSNSEKKNKKKTIVVFRVYSTDHNEILHTTVTLSWCMQNFIVIGRAYFELEHYKFLFNFEFDRNISLVGWVHGLKYARPIMIYILHTSRQSVLQNFIEFRFRLKYR